MTKSSDATRRVVHLRSAGTALILDLRQTGLPTVVHWGADPGPCDEAELEAVAEAAVPPHVINLVDGPVSHSVLPEGHTGWFGIPGLSGSRGGQAWAPRFTVSEAVQEGRRLTVEAADPATALGLRLTVELTGSGLVRLRTAVRNDGNDDCRVDAVSAVLPVPDRAVELLDLTGRWSQERQPQRGPFPVGVHLREGRRGRTGADAATVLVAGTTGFGFRSGEVWAVHTAWSGNHRTWAERTGEGFRTLGGGESLLPGEIVLRPGESYQTPELYFGWADGLDELAARFHRHLRERPGHPRSPRPVNLNVWEAVYFDHDLGKLLTLAERGAAIGVERFVLDDGWFHHRNGPDRGLGDWFVDERTWPGGLHPLVNRVKELGMTFGLWFEPEMISPNSQLAVEHPEWILRARPQLPPASRWQQVLDLAEPEAFAYVLERMSDIIAEYGVGYLKWDHNRDLIEAPGVHRQTLAAYRLMDELRAAFPGLEIESCSSGGARVDLAILEHTDRVWASDCIDPLERQSIQRWTSQLIPLELIGGHVASAVSHTTGRRHDLAFRAITSLFAHFGLELDLTALDDAETASLASWIALYKHYRELLHSGTLVRDEHPSTGRWLTGVVTPELALYSVAAVRRSREEPAGRMTFPGLDPARRYAIRLVGPDRDDLGNPPRWLDSPAVFGGATLATIGVRLPSLLPETAMLIEVAVVP
ncbi:alpha-galactosidase [Nonomuraea jabiensis]|uniref:alpha-galactosidase n=1 Tax=Nonomuraea jabiensis TaxID=882448 RepID=A0A7W9G850_9ACTN|nr:alpha-galactosidase [Nonomuraea jabiensis]MBB5778968.1 alpha-galactosidase [Nonomuraea jabiensis]